MMQTKILNPQLVDQAWSDIAPFIEDAVDESCGELTVQDIKRRIEDTTAIALCIINEDMLLAVGILEKIIYPSSKTVLGIICLGGTQMEDWVEAIDHAIVSIAEEQDCHEVRIVGRPGWVKTLKKIGWGQTHVILSKRI